MGGHLLTLQTGMNECDAWSRTLLERFRRTAIGSKEAEALRQEIKAYLDGQQGECAQIEEVYSDTSDKYLAVILALLTGASAAGGVAVGLGATRQATPPKPDPPTPPTPDPPPPPDPPPAPHPPPPPDPPRAETPLDRIRARGSL